ncbi:MAG: hypothetical protein FJX76_25045 [Armatimonadetes bacterium]|nr:hypothetical protein [Armatimonadota bacterium]
MTTIQSVTAPPLCAARPATACAAPESREPEDSWSESATRGRDALDFGTIRNARTAAMLPMMDAGVQLALNAATAAVMGGAASALVSVEGYLAHHHVRVDYNVSAAGLAGEGTIGGIPMRDGIALLGEGGNGVMTSQVGKAKLEAHGHMHGERLHVDGTLGGVTMHMTIGESAEEGDLRLSGYLNGSEFHEDLAFGPSEDAGAIEMVATGHVGRRKLERSYVIRHGEDGALAIDGQGRLGRGNPTDLHIEMHVQRA